jgi:mycothiol synthase
MSESTERDRIVALVDAVAAADGVRPLNDEAMLALGSDGVRHWVLRDGDEAVGYAQYAPAFGTAQLCVHPGCRRRGLGRTLLADVLAAGASGVWAFGDLPAARGLAAASGLHPTRGLLIMERSLVPAPACPTAPPGVTLRPFSDADAPAFLAVNAAAFAHHPEQGAFSAADLAARQREPWWDAAGLIVAEDAAGLVGFHWTKRHDAATGEVYVIGVDPQAHGQGLGTVLLDAGLAHLAASGCTRVILYVEADNPAVRLYERKGFAVAHTDVLYGAN